MVAFEISDSLARKIRAIAQHQNRSVEEVLSEMVAGFEASEQMPVEASDPLSDPLLDLVGLFRDSDVTDASTTIRETMSRIYDLKHEYLD